MWLIRSIHNKPHQWSLAADALIRQLIRYLRLIIVVLTSACGLVHAAQAWEIEAGYSGTIHQLGETRTPYNTILADAQGNPLLLSFEFGAYTGKLSVETTALNHLFAMPQMLVAENKMPILGAIKSNRKFPIMLDYYRQYLKTRDQVKLDFYLKMRDSLLLDLADQNRSEHWY